MEYSLGSIGPDFLSATAIRGSYKIPFNIDFHGCFTTIERCCCWWLYRGDKRWCGHCQVWKWCPTNWGVLNSENIHNFTMHAQAAKAGERYRKLLRPVRRYFCAWLNSHFWACVISTTVAFMTRSLYSSTRFAKLSYLQSSLVLRWLLKPHDREKVL
jgi:hypothetical protein